MLTFLFDALNVKPEERVPVGLMLGAGFFMGIFIATYQVTAESLFISTLSSQLDKAFLISGILGILSTLVFSFLQNRIKFTTLTITSIATIVLVTTAIYILYHLGSKEIHNYVLFIMFCLIGPITAILLLCYWGVFGRLFNFKQSKRIIGWIDTGQLVAAILSYFIIPLTSSLFPDTSNYLLVCNISIFFALTCLVIISIKFTLTKNNPAEFDNTVKRETRFDKIFKDKYIVLLSLFIIISMVTYVLNQYSFQNLMNKQYPDQKSLTNFLAYFNGALYIISFVMQTFINDKLMTNYGLKISLYILPLVVGIFTLITFLSGSIFGYDQTSPTAFIFFFLFVALSRLFNGTLRDSLENPVFKLLFIPLDARYRFSIQAKVEGVVNETGRLVAGLLIISFALIPFFEIIYIPIIILLLAGAYILVAKNLHNGYKAKIRSKLENREFQQDKLEIGFAQITARLEDFLTHNETSKAIFSYKLLEKINPSKVSKWLNSLMGNSREETKEYAQKKMNELKGLSVSERYVIRKESDASNDSDSASLTKVNIEMIIKSGGDFGRPRILQLMRSQEPEDRQYAAELLLNSSSDENISLLIELLNDPVPKVRNTAIKTATKRYNNEVILSLIDNLVIPTYCSQAMDALTLIGNPALNALESCFFRTGKSTVSLLKIIQVIGRIGGQRAKEILWNKIDFPDKVVGSQIILSLGESGFKAGISQVTRIKYAIESDVADIRWNLSALVEVGNDGTKDIIEALEWENQSDIDHIYMLLAMLYDTNSIQLVKENIESGTAEGTTYAIELLDAFLSDQLKQRVIPVLDDMSINEKNARLDIYYPRIKLDERLVLKFLINRDFAQTNRWTKACVIHQIGRNRISEFLIDLIAQIYNPDKLVREVAGWSLFQIDPDEYHKSIMRLGEDQKKEFDQVVLSTEADSKRMLYEIIKFYAQLPVFEGIPGITISNLADISEEVHLNTGQSLVVDEKSNNFFFIVFSGEAEYFNSQNTKSKFNRGQFIGERLSSSHILNSHVIYATEPVILFKMEKDLFYETLSENVKLADKILQFI